MKIPARAREILLRFVGVSVLLILALLMMGFPQCQTRNLCSSGATLLDAVSSRTEIDPAAPATVLFWIDIAAAGVYSPTLPWPGTLGWLPRSDGVDPIPPFLDDLAGKGYVAIRVPHAPPSYAPSQLIPGTGWSPNVVEFTYYSPPEAETATTVPISVTRRVDYEAIVNARYPIADGRSHWEVWWVQGDRFPIPEGTFRLKEDWPQALEVMFRLDFGEGASADTCMGCPVDILFYNGYTFLGPWRRHITDEGRCSARSTALEWDMCGADTSASMVQYIDSGVPFTHTHWLGNYEAAERTYIVTASSSQSWDYTYYYGPKEGPYQQAAGLPFEVTIGPAPGSYPCASCIGIHAVYTPTLSLNEPLREMFTLTATSKISPSLSANTVSMALGHGYRLDEASPTPTEAPSATPTETPTVTPTHTPSPTREPTRTRTPEPTQGVNRAYLPMVLQGFGGSRGR